jgi:hypothetical protein
LQQFDFVVRITKTREWPDGDEAQVGSAIILSSEDAIKDTIVPRLAAADTSNPAASHRLTNLQSPCANA